MTRNTGKKSEKMLKKNGRPGNPPPVPANDDNKGKKRATAVDLNGRKVGPKEQDAPKNPAK